MGAGCAGALVARPGVVASPLGRQPDIIGPDLAVVVDRVVAIDGQPGRDAGTRPGPG